MTGDGGLDAGDFFDIMRAASRQRRKSITLIQRVGCNVITTPGSQRSIDPLIGDKMPQKFKMRSTMALVTFSGMIALSLTDLGFVVFGGVDQSLSAFLARGAYFPHLPPLSFFIFGMGAIMSHLFWGMYPDNS